MTAMDQRPSSCDPRLCALAEVPHSHCSCGLPTAPDETACRLCIQEQVDPIEQPRGRTGDPAAWDGVSYPSRRRRRTRVDRERYVQLLEIVLSPTEPDYLRLDGLLSRHRRREPAPAVDGVPSATALRLACELASAAGEVALVGRSRGEASDV